MGVCHFVVGGVLGNYGIYTPEGVDGNLNVLITLPPGRASHVVIAFSYLLIVVYALTLAPVAWVYAAEVWSLETRAYGMALASIANWLFNVSKDKILNRQYLLMRLVCSWSLCPSCIPQYYMEDIHHLRRVVSRCSSSSLRILSRDGEKEFGRN
jgi:hypothetical protein